MVGEFGTFGTGIGQFILPLDIELDAAGNVYVYDNERGDVQVFTPDGVFVRTAATQIGPYQAVDPDGAVYGVGQERILYRFAADGSVDLAVDLSRILDFATGLALSPTGDLFIASSNDGGSNPIYESLFQLSPNGELLYRWPNGAESIAIDPTGERIYTAGHTDGSPAVHAYRLPAD